MDLYTQSFQGIFRTDNWPPRWLSGYWTDFHGWLYIVSDILIGISYLAIPVFLLTFIFKKKDIPLPKVFWLFGLFILACGLTHIVDALVFWWPIYGFSTLLRFITALISVITVIALFRMLPQALNLTTSAEYKRELEQRKEAEQKLRRANELLEEKNREVEQFVYIASHDLQEPLRTVKSMVELTQRSYIDQLDEESVQYFQYINEATQRMQLLISGLLDYSRLGQDRQLVQADVAKILQDVLSDLDTKIQESNTKISIGEMPVITGYATELRLLFQNLINNAIKFVKPGEDPHITIEAEEQDNHWLFSIHDQGIGIKDKFKDKIFVIFKQLNHREKFGGSGIGLAHCKKIVELHGGRIWVESEYGKGSTFYFTISKKSRK